MQNNSINSNSYWQLGRDSSFYADQDQKPNSDHSQKKVPSNQQKQEPVDKSVICYRSNSEIQAGGDSALYFALEALTISTDSSSNSCPITNHEKQTIAVDYLSSQRLLDLRGHKRGIWRLASLGPTNVISASYDHTSIVWDVPQNQLLKTFHHKSEVLSIDIADGLIFTGSSDGCLKIWDADTLKMKSTFSENERYRRGFYSIASIGTDLIATGACQKPKYASHWSHDLKIWNPVKGKFLFNLKGHKGGIPKIVKIQDDKLVSCSADKTIKIWNLIGKECSHTLEGHTDYIYSMCLTQNQQLLSCSQVTDH